MKRLATVAAAIALVGTPAVAAPPAPAPAYSWTGFYVGGNVGYGWGDARTDIAGSATTEFLGKPIANLNNTVALNNSNADQLNGVIGGGQFGYNFQFSPRWLLGFEADIQGSGERGSNSSATPFSFPLCTGLVNLPPLICAASIPGAVPGLATTAYNAEINWFGTVRGRVGFLIGDQFLLYGTGGLAYGRVELSGATSVSASVLPNPAVGPASLTPAASAFSESKTNLGFVVGGGMEGRLSYWLPPNWTWKLEYLYVDLGSVDTAAPITGGATLGLRGQLLFSAFTGAVAAHTHFTDNIFRVGLNYQFH